MAIYMMIPALLLALFQLVMYFFVDEFYISPQESTDVIVFMFYMSFVLGILAFSATCPRAGARAHEPYKKDKSVLFFIFVIALTVFFIVIPTVKMFLLMGSVGYENIRMLVFRSDEFAAAVFGSRTVQSLTQNYIKYALWIVALFLSEKNNKERILFLFVVFSLVLFNMAYAGRFSLYYLFVVFFLKSMVEQKKISAGAVKLVLCAGLVFFISYLILVYRLGGDLMSGSSVLESLLRYHWMQPFLLAQKIESEYIFINGFPFRSVVEAVFFPIYYFFGVSFSELSIGEYLSYFNEPTLMSHSTGSYANAFVTLFPYFYADFKLFGPLFVFLFFVYVSFCSKLIDNDSVRVRYLACFALFMFFSLFQGELFVPMVISFIVFFPWVWFFVRVGKVWK